MSFAARLWRPALCALLPAVLFLAATVPSMPEARVVGGQDERHNAVRGLRALYEGMNPSYFIHPALYYEALAAAYGVHRGLSGAGSAGYLERFVSDEESFLELARSVSVFFGALAVIAAVWLAAELSVLGAACLAGLVLAGMPLLTGYSTFIRVDSLALCLFLAGAALLVRWRRERTRKSLLRAAAGIGLAAAANYPGALLLGLLAYWLPRGKEAPSVRERIKTFGLACLVSFGVFLILNPYVILDLPLFLHWFGFQAKTVLSPHPQAGSWSLFRYFGVLWAQGPVCLLAVVIGAAALTRKEGELRGLAGFGVLYFLLFTFMRSQYDRFVLPALALLTVVGAVAAWRWAEPRLSGAAERVRIGVGLAAAALIVAAGAPKLLSAGPRGGRDVPDPRGEMRAWMESGAADCGLLLFESDTLSILQTAYDPGARGRDFEKLLRQAFLKLHPRMPKRVLKSQYIGGVYNYDPKLLDEEEVCFLGSSKNRGHILSRCGEYLEPCAFYKALDVGFRPLRSASGAGETLTFWGRGSRVK